VTTEQELKLAVLAVVVDGDATAELGVVDAADEVGVVDAAVGAVVGGLDDLEDEPHAANPMARETAATAPKALRRSLIGPPPRP